MHKARTWPPSHPQCARNHGSDTIIACKVRCATVGADATVYMFSEVKVHELSFVNKLEVAVERSICSNPAYISRLPSYRDQFHLALNSARRRRLNKWRAERSDYIWWTNIQETFRWLYVIGVSHLGPVELGRLRTDWIGYAWCLWYNVASGDNTQERMGYLSQRNQSFFCIMHYRLIYAAVSARFC